MAQSQSRQPFMAHVEEMRYRLTWSVLALLVGASLGYYLRDHLINILSAPLGLPLYYTSPGGGFNLIIQLCVGFGLIIALPVLIFHVVKFVAPIVPKYSRRLLGIIVISSSLLVIAGLLFAYFVSLPAALYFLSEFSNEQVKALISTDTYLSFVSIYLVGFAVLFQLPLLVLLLNHITPLKPQQLMAKFRWVVLGSVIIAAILTPTPDPFNQLIMAGPVVGLYGLSIGMVGVTNRNRKPGFVFMSVEDALLDLSNKRLIAKTEAAHKGRSGYICLWEDLGWESARRQTVTFLYKGKHELVIEKDFTEAKEVLVPSLF